MRGEGTPAARWAPLLLLVLAQGMSAQSTVGGSGPSSLSPQPTALTPSYVPHRVYDTRKKSFIDFETLTARLARADIVFVGEQHDDPGTHRMELAILEGVARRRDSVTLALEMFERDVQPLLDGYLSGTTPEEELLKQARPWKNYPTDYRPLVELARARGWPVVASNVPRPFASAVARTGLGLLDTLAPERRSQISERIACPEDEYFKKFKAVMGDLSTHGPGAPSPDSAAARLTRVYQAQCIKDETMGESVARAWRPGRLVVHYNGSFHSDFRLGTAERARQRAEGAEVVVVTAVPTADLDRLDPSGNDRKRADYLLYVLAPAKAEAPSR